MHQLTSFRMLAANVLDNLYLLPQYKYSIDDVQVTCVQQPQTILSFHKYITCLTSLQELSLMNQNSHISTL